MVDIRNDENIYGPLMSIIKSKSTRIIPRPVIKDDIQIPSEIYKNNSNIELFIYVICINGVAFLVYIYRQVEYRSIVHITSQNEEDFSKLLTKSFESIIWQYFPSLSFM